MPTATSVLPLEHIADASAETPARVRLLSTALGEIEVLSTWMIDFPTPLGGFPTQQAYALIPAAREGLWWLQAANDPDLTFLLADPFVQDASYGFDIGEVEREMIGVSAETDAFGLVMITLPNATGELATGNFRAPLVFNLTKQVALQVVSRDDRHAVRTPVDLSAYTPQAIGLRMR